MCIILQAPQYRSPKWISYLRDIKQVQSPLRVLQLRHLQPRLQRLPENADPHRRRGHQFNPQGQRIRYLAYGDGAFTRDHVPNGARVRKSRRGASSERFVANGQMWHLASGNPRTNVHSVSPVWNAGVGSCAESIVFQLQAYPVDSIVSQVWSWAETWGRQGTVSKNLRQRTAYAYV